MVKKEQSPPVDFGDAGIRYKEINRNVTHTIQSPWIYRFNNTDPSLFSLIPSITDEFTVIESTSFDGFHSARITDNKRHQLFDIELNRDHIKVYPTTNDHQESSERLYLILKKYYPGHLDSERKKHGGI